MRKFLIRLVIIVALLGVVALVLPGLVDVNRYRGQIQAELERRLDRKVSLGAMRLSIFPLAFQVSDMAIAEDPRFGEGKLFARAEEVQVEARLWPLLKGEIQVDSLEMRRPHVELIRNPKGEWNFASLGKPPVTVLPPPAATGTTPAAPPASPAPAQGTPLSLASLKIAEGQIAVTDQRSREPGAVNVQLSTYDHIDLTLTDYASGRAFDFRLAAHLPGAGAQEISLEGRTGPVAEAWAATPFDGKLKLNQVSLASLQKFLHAAALADSDAIASGEATLRNLGGKLESKGSLKLDQLRLRGVALGFPVAANYDIVGDTKLGAYTINQGQLQLGATPVSIRGTVVTAPDPVQLNLGLKIAATDVSLEELARLGAAFGVAFNPKTKIAGRLTADLEAEGAASRPSLRGGITARDVVITGGDLPQPVRADSVALSLTPSALRSNRFTASTGGTSVAVELLLTDYAADNARLDAMIETGNADLGELLAIARAWGVSAAEGVTGSGEASLSLRATGPLASAARRSYSGSGHLRNALLKLPALAQPLRVAQAGLRFTESTASIEDLNASLGQTSATGNFRLRDFTSPRVEFTLAADKMNLDEWQQLLVAGPRSAAASRGAAASAANPWDLLPRAQAAAAPSPSLLARATGSGSLTVATVIYDRLTLNNVRSQVTLDHGFIRMSPLTAEVYGGKQSGTIVLDARSTPVTYSVSTKMERVDANQLLSAVSSVKDKLFGLLAANGETHFTAFSSGDVARTLDGKVNLNLNDGKINNMDLLYEIASAGKFLAVGRKMKPFTDLAQLSGDLDINHGLLRTDNLKAVISEGRMAASGTASLVDQSLNLRVVAVLSKEFSEEVGGAGVGGYLTTALANKNGELVVPLIVTGTFEKPRFAPDLRKIAEMKLENLAPTLSNPGELGSVLGSIFGKKGKGGKQQEPGAEGDASPGSQDPLGGILETLGGKKKKDEKQADTKEAEPAAGQQPAQPSSPLEDILGAISGQKKKPAKQTPTQPPAQSQKPEDQQQPPPEQPK